jgi:hypothetical protein
MFIKGVAIREGEISNVLAQYLPIPEEPVSLLRDDVAELALGTETYQFRVYGLNLLIGERGKVSAQQSVPLFIDPDKRCGEPAPPSNGLLRRVRLEWTGDIDGDERADFLVYASAYRNCALPVLHEDPEHFLILSSEGGKGEVGMVVPMVGHHPQK